MSVIGSIDQNIPILGSSDFKWSMTKGVKPYETTIDLRPQDAATLLSRPMIPVRLTFSDGRGVPGRA